MIYVHLQVVAILCIEYLGSLIFFLNMNIKLPRIVNVYILMYGSLGIFISAIIDQGLCMC